MAYQTKLQGLYDADFAVMLGENTIALLNLKTPANHIASQSAVLVPPAFSSMFSRIFFAMFSQIFGLCFV